MKNVIYACAIVGAATSLLTGCGGGSSNSGNTTGQIPTTYTVTNINDVLPGNNTQGFGNQVFGINNLGQVVGHYFPVPGTGYSYLYSNGSYQNITIPGSSQGQMFYAQRLNNNSQILGFGPSQTMVVGNGLVTDINQITGNADFSGTEINDTGQIAGTLLGSDLNRHLAIYQNNTIQDLGFLPGHAGIHPTKINASGEITGDVSNTSEPITRAFSYQSGHFTELGTLPSYTDSEANSINDAGDIVGASGNAASDSQYYSLDNFTVCHAFLFKNGVMTDLGTLPGDDSSIAYGINSSGVIVGGSGGMRLNTGTVVAYHGLFSAFIYRQGKMLDLNTLIPQASGLHLNTAVGINDQGQILVNGSVGSGSSIKPGVFVLTPKQ